MCHPHILHLFSLPPLTLPPFLPPSIPPSLPQAEGEYQQGDPEWCADDQVSYEAQAKVKGIRLLVSWLTGLQSDYDHWASPVLRLLDTVLAHDGDLQGDDNIR